MQNAYWLAAIFGPFLIIVGLWALFFKDNMSKVHTSMKSTAAVYHMKATFNLLLGLILISTFNDWTPSLAIFVTLLGWYLLVQGISALFLPHVYAKIWMNPNTCVVLGVVKLVWGVLLCWFAFAS